MLSMTAFATSKDQCNGLSFTWEIKSVNHRYLDASFRLPELFRSLEGALRTHLREVLSRGKVDCFLKVNSSSLSGTTLSINESFVSDLVTQASRLANHYGIANDLSVSQVLSYPGVVTIAEVEVNGIAKFIEASFVEALKSLKLMRLQEGQQLKSEIAKRLITLQTEIENSRYYTIQSTQVMKEKLLTKLKGLALESTDTRIEQEIALLLSKLDVSEELDRLSLHVKEVTRLLDSEEALGRRLDFLMQELNREANTLSSKSESIELTQSAVTMKVIIEQMREQIQNIE